MKARMKRTTALLGLTGAVALAGGGSAGSAEAVPGGSQLANGSTPGGGIGHPPGRALSTANPRTAPAKPGVSTSELRMAMAANRRGASGAGDPLAALARPGSRVRVAMASLATNGRGPPRVGM